MLDGIFERMSVPMLGKALDITSLRQKIIAGNIANVMTPGYVKKEVNFEESLTRAMGKKGLKGLRKDQRHIPIGSAQKNVKPILIQDKRPGNVNIDKEMASSAENQIFYSTVTQIVSGRFKALKKSIQGRT